MGLVAAWYDDERSQHFYYSQPLYANQIVFFKRKDTPINFKEYLDLATQKLRLAEVQGYLNLPGLRESGALELRPMYLLLSKQDPRSELLIQQFDSGLSALRQSGQYQKIIDTLLPLSYSP